MTQRMEGPGYALGAPVLIVADDPRAAEAAREAVELVSARAVECVAWNGASERLYDHGMLRALLIEATRVDEEEIARLLPELAAAARARDIRVVVSLDASQIDTVAAHLLGGEIELLCAPSIADRIAALCPILAPAGCTAVREAGREAEASRLRRLNAEVARIAETLARLSRDNIDPAPRSPAVADRTTDYEGPPSDLPASASRDIRTALRARRLRDRVIPGGLFEDPAWDMLLDLMAAELERAQVSVSSLCIAAAVAPTTALRWIGKLVDSGLIERRPDPFDRRRAFIMLTPTGRDAMRRYLVTVRQEGLPIA